MRWYVPFIFHSLSTQLPFVGSLAIPLESLWMNPLHSPIFFPLSASALRKPVGIVNVLLRSPPAVTKEYRAYNQSIHQLKQCKRREDCILLECLDQSHFMTTTSKPAISLAHYCTYFH